MASPATTFGPTFAELFTPKLVTVLREGYGLRHLKADAVAGLTVAIVALPLSMAIAIASGLTPDRGLYQPVDKMPPPHGRHNMERHIGALRPNILWR